MIEVQQILINLCTNSYQAMKDAGRIDIVFDLWPGMPIIMTTGYTDTLITGHLRSLGIRGTLAKPCPSRLLLTAVRNALDHSN